MISDTRVQVNHLTNASAATYCYFAAPKKCRIKSVVGTLQGDPGIFRHRDLFCGRRPKKTGPFQRVPVIKRAIDESDLYGRPRYSKSSLRTVT